MTSIPQPWNPRASLVATWASRERAICGDLAVCMADWAPGGSPAGGDSGESTGSQAVEWKDAAGKVVPEHPFGLRR